MATTNAEATKRRAAAAVEAPPPAKAGQGELYDESQLPPDCPVTALGLEGQKLWVLDAANQLLPISPDCRKGDTMLLFGGHGWLDKHFPSFRPAAKKGDPPIPDGFNQKEIQQALIAACTARGIFNPQGRVFGRGAHRARHNSAALMLHMGTEVMMAGAADHRGKALPEQVHRAGRIRDAYYPARPPLPPPAREVSTREDAEALMGLFRRWFWVDGTAAPLLLLGMSAQMHICGALGWRSHMWLPGPTASGKSLLQSLLRAIHADWCLGVSDASEAAIRQVLGDDTLPVLIDEAEADDNPDRQRAILNLAKKASSGDKIIRGGADHKGQEFTAQSCFLFTSVLHGQMKGEDRNRIAILDMHPIPATAPPLDIDLNHWREMGRRMHTKMIREWPRFDHTLRLYRTAIHEQGYVGRWQDTFGTLLACADLLLFDHAPDNVPMHDDCANRLRDWVHIILPMLATGRSEARTDTERCLVYLLSSQVPGSHGAPPETIGALILRAMSLRVTDGEGVDTAARERLKSYGLRVVLLDGNGRLTGDPVPGDWGNALLAVAHATCRPLAELFKGTEWAGGGYIQSLRKAEGVRKNLKIRFGGVNSDNAIALPLNVLKPEGVG
jgi:hypothetical protein